MIRTRADKSRGRGRRCATLHRGTATPADWRGQMLLLLVMMIITITINITMTAVIDKKSKQQMIMLTKMPVAMMETVMQVG